MAPPVTIKWCLQQLVTNRIININVSENSMVGRSGDATVCLTSHKSSRKHAAFVVNIEGNLLLQDLKSINGTFVNGTQIEVYNLRRVFPGDTISFGLSDIDRAEDERDRLVFFKVLYIDESIQKGVVDSSTHSTTDAGENSVPDSTLNSQNRSDEIKPEPIDIIEIISDMSEHMSVESVKVGTIPEDQLSSSKNCRETRRSKNSTTEAKKIEVQALSRSLETSKKPENLPRLRISGRRRTIHVEPKEVTALNETRNDLEQTSKPAKRITRRKSICTVAVADQGNPEKLSIKESIDHKQLVIDLKRGVLGIEDRSGDDKRPKKNGDETKLKNKKCKTQNKLDAKSNVESKEQKSLEQKPQLAKAKRISQSESVGTNSDIDQDNSKKIHERANSDCDELLMELDRAISGNDYQKSYEQLKLSKKDVNETKWKNKTHSNSDAKRKDTKDSKPRISSSKKDKAEQLDKHEKSSKGLSNAGIENLELQEFNLGASNIGFEPMSSTSDKRFSVNKDNSVVIDITEDDKEDDMDFSCSQIFQMSEIVKTEAPDESYQKIKNELAEMDYCPEEFIVNTVPINLENDFDNTGFENTQSMCAFLQDGIEPGNKDFGTSTTDHPPVLEEVNLKDNKAVEHENKSLTKREKSNASRKSSEKQKTTKPPVIEAHIMTKPTKKLKQSPGKSNKDDNKLTLKRKSSMEVPVENKKIRSNSKPLINPLNYNQKDIVSELKRRHSSSKEVDKGEKATIREERRKKLKELTSTSTTTSSDPDKPSTSMEITDVATDKRKNPNSLALKKLETKNTVSSKSKSTDPSLKPMYLPPSLPNTYNLRRAKSSDEIKLKQKNAELNEPPNRPATRHRSCINVSDLPSTSSSTFNSRPETRSTTRADPRRVPAQMPQNVLHSNPSYGNNLTSTEASRRLMWTNGGPSRRQPARKLPNVDDVTKKMVNWLPNWLTEQVDVDCSPPVNKPAATKIPLHFRTFNEYYNTFSRLIMLENWQYLFKSFRDGQEKPKYVKIDHVRVFNELTLLDCVCYITRQQLKQGHFLKPDDFLLMECIMNDARNNYRSVNFGLVQNCRKTTISNDTLISVKLGNLCPGDPHTKLEFTVMTRYQPGKDMNMRNPPIVKLIANVRGHFMLIKAIKALEQSPLCPMILNPKLSDYKFPVSHRQIKHPTDLNPQQKAIVLEAASLCTGDKHGIYCFKGPPGTGKSTVIVNLIFQIIFSHQFSRRGDKPPMILLAAPSNTAVDNLITKLVAIKHGLSNELQHLIKLVRIGPESSISKAAVGYSLPKLAEKHVPLRNIEIPEMKAARDRNENLVEFSKKYFGSQYGHELKMCENLIIEKSNIICTTLNSCINGRLIESVNRGLIEFSCCIIDEATQCHEVEALLPIILGINKLVLVGDPQQLNATIMNRDALKLGFGESLFTRLANNIGNDPRSPIKMLTDQYRMHPEICSFPNKQFYEGKLRNCAKPTNKLPEEIRPYLVFNCEKTNHSKTDYTNIDEVVLIQILLSTIFDMVKRNQRFTVGIITPYNAQKDLICKNIAELVEKNEHFKVTVNTVDSFQGSENDIIIISCVRDSSNSFLQNRNRLNVALTRAKQALYIIGNYTLFKECRPLYDLREDAKRRKVLLDIKQNPQSIANFAKYLLRKPNSGSSSSKI